MKNKDNVYNKNIYVGNLGSKINTDMPEYVPVINNNNELIFTINGPTMYLFWNFPKLKVS